MEKKKEDFPQGKEKITTITSKTEKNKNKSNIKGFKEIKERRGHWGGCMF